MSAAGVKIDFVQIDFTQRYMKKLFGNDTETMARDLAQALAMYPQLKDGMERMKKEAVKLDGTPYEHAAQGFLLSIYETEKDWPKAISITRRMEAVSKTPQFKEIAHYHCEMAQAALARSDFATAAAEIDLARAEYRAVGEWLNDLSHGLQFRLLHGEDAAMPANNRTLVWQRAPLPNG